MPRLSSLQSIVPRDCALSTGCHHIAPPSTFSNHPLLKALKPEPHHFTLSFCDVRAILALTSQYSEVLGPTSPITRQLASVFDRVALVDLKARENPNRAPRLAWSAFATDPDTLSMDVRDGRCARIAIPVCYDLNAPPPVFCCSYPTYHRFFHTCLDPSGAYNKYWTRSPSNHHSACTCFAPAQPVAACM